MLIKDRVKKLEAKINPETTIFIINNGEASGPGGPYTRQQYEKRKAEIKAAGGDTLSINVIAVDPAGGEDVDGWTTREERGANER